MWPSRHARPWIANTALASFIWMVSGAAAHAECHIAQANPLQYLAQKANDPRLALPPKARQQLQAAAERLAARRAQRLAACPDPKAETDAVQSLRRTADELAGVEQGLAAAPSGALDHVKEKARDIRSRLTNLQDQVVQSLTGTEVELVTQGAADVIRERAQSARHAYEEQMRAVLDDLGATEAAATADEARGALGRVIQRLRSNSAARPEQPVDPNQLPFRAPESEAQPPRQTDAEFETAAATASTAPALAWVSGTRTLSALANQLSSLWLPGTVTAAPLPEELAPNEDVQITPAIQALASSLNNEPLEIYDWVRNNIEFVPTYGSVQGSQMTLEAKRGSAFDTASLLIALLRAAGVPARYVVGTVEIPADAVRNWVGGTETPQVAQQLLGQGGIPNVGLSDGTSTTHIRLEHVWVEAWIDYVPSRGAVQREGDTWVPMDASFKQHAFTPPSNLLGDVPFDLQALSDQMLAGAEVDPVLNRIVNIDQDVIFPSLDSWQQQARAYLAANGLPETPQGILGGSTIITDTSEVFPGSLPYRVIARGTGQATLPAGLRHYVTLKGFTSVFGRALGSQSFTYRISLPQLNSRRLGLRFDPATPADAATLASAQSGNGASIPVYLINVVPVVTLDGTPMATGTSVRMGSFQAVDVILESPRRAPTTIPYDNVVAGDEIVVGITGNGVTEDVVRARFNAFPPDNAPEYLHQVQLHYWLQTDFFNGLTAKALGVHMQRLPSVGLFSSPLTASYLFGAPISGVYQSRVMDVKQSLLGAAGSDPQTVRTFHLRAGYQGSFMEAAAFDQFEGGEIRKGISAVQLIADAATVGIPVYQITSANAASVLPLLSLDARVKSDISNAIAAGKTVLAPGENFDRGPWRGVGYIIQDPATGAGAYLISGGVNGGGLIDCLPDLVPIFVTILFVVLIIILLILLALALAAALAAAPQLAYALALLVAMLVATSPGPGTA